MTNNILEGTWEEIVEHSSELAGRRVRVTLLDETQPNAGTPNYAMLAVMQSLLDDYPESRMTSGEDTEDLLRAARSGAMYGDLE